MRWKNQKKKAPQCPDGDLAMETPIVKETKLAGRSRVGQSGERSGGKNTVAKKYYEVMSGGDTGTRER